MSTLRIRIYLLNIIFWATLFPVAPTWYRWLAPVLILILLIDELHPFIDSKQKSMDPPSVEDRPLGLSLVMSLLTILLLFYFISQISSLTWVFKIIVIACAALILLLEAMEWGKRIRGK